MSKNSNMRPESADDDADAPRISAADRETYAECDRVRFLATLHEAAQALQSCARDASTRDCAEDPVLRRQIERCALDVATRLLPMVAASEEAFDTKYAALLGGPYPADQPLIYPLIIAAMRAEAKRLDVTIVIETRAESTH
jgi:hypothetical protein